MTKWSWLGVLGLAACGTTAGSADGGTDAAGGGTDAAGGGTDAADVQAADGNATDAMEPQPDATQNDAADALEDAAPDAAPDSTPDAAADAGEDAAADATQNDAQDTSATVPFAAVQGIFEARCTNCHNAQALGLPGYAKLPLTADVAWQNLVNQPADESCGGMRVVPGQPAQSYLWRKLTQTQPCAGGPMPAQFEVMPASPLTADQLDTVRNWILGGASK
jgi:hypothetical protein